MNTHLPRIAVFALLLSGAVAAQKPPPPAPKPAPPAPSTPAPSTPAPATTAPAPPAPAAPAPEPATPAPAAPRAPGLAPHVAAPGLPTPLPVILVTPRAPALGSELLGTPVTDFSGRTLGSVVDLVVPASMELIAVVKRSDGDLVCVPMSRLLARLHKPERDAEKSKLAPTASVESFIFSQDPLWLAGAEPVESAGAIDAAAVQRCRETFLGREAQVGAAGSADSGCPPWALAQLLTGSVKDSGGKQVGAVKDVAVNLARAQAAYLVISAADTGGRLHGAATGLLHCGEDGLSLLLPMTAHELRVVFPGLDLEHLPMQPDLPSLGPVAPVADTPNS